MTKRITADAERVAKGAEPLYAARDYEQAMLDHARGESRQDESTAAAFARLCETDSRMDALYKAACAAGELRDEREERELLAKHREEMWPLMVKAARGMRRPSETVEQALDRLLTSDPTFKRVYASTFAG